MQSRVGKANSVLRLDDKFKIKLKKGHQYEREMNFQQNLLQYKSLFQEIFALIDKPIEFSNEYICSLEVMRTSYNETISF